MHPRDSKELITPAARELLDDIVKDYEGRLLAAAVSSASRLTGEPREVSVHDVLAGLEAARPRTRTRRSSQLDRILNLYVGVGALMSAVGILAWMLQNADMADFRMKLPLLAAASGVLISVTSFVLLRMRSLRTDNGSFDAPAQVADSPEYAFVETWRSLELELRRVVADEFGESQSSLSFSALLDYVARTRGLSSSDLAEIRRLLDLRNRIVHQGGPFSPMEVRDAMRNAERLRVRLSRTAHPAI